MNELESTCESWASSMKDAGGRKLRKDALCLVAGVVSAPADIGEGWEAFRDASVDWLKKRYGDQLQTVIEHVDEDQPHIHFYATPAPGARFESIHEGRAAADAIKGKGTKASREVAYSAAMTRYQDDFSEQVGLRHGMSRMGPGAPRVSRAEAVKRKEIRKELGAQLVRDVKVAVHRGERRGFAQGKTAGLAKGEAEGIELAKAEFEKKSLFAKLSDFIKGLSRENDELKRKLETSESTRKGLVEKFDKLRTTTSGYFDKLKKVMPELEKLRSNEAKYQRQDRELTRLSNELTDTKEKLSSAKGKIGMLEFELEPHREKEAEEARKAQQLLDISKTIKRPLSRRIDDELDYS